MTTVSNATAQISPDVTLSTTVTSPDNLNFLIEGGDRAGNNLFHSFDEFSIPSNGAAIFEHAADIETIFSRVTGKNESVIDGTIQAQGQTNVFLMNPNGIVFNDSAQLNIGGSFIATTASSLIFDDDIEFSASTKLPLLSVNTPIGLQMGLTPGDIQINGPGQNIFTTIESEIIRPPLTALTNPAILNVSPGKTLALIGGNISLNGGSLRADEGHISLGSTSNGQVKLQPNASGWHFDYDNVTLDRDISLIAESAIGSSGETSHGITLAGQDIVVADGSIIAMQVGGNAAQAQISVQATTVEITGVGEQKPLVSRLVIELNDEGTAGNLEIESQQLVLSNGVELGMSHFSSGSSGDINLNVTDSILIRGVSPSNRALASRLGIAALSSGNAGDLNISTARLRIENGGSIGSTSFLSSGSVGNVIINATESVVVVGRTPGTTITQIPASSLITTATVGTGDAGDLLINTPYLKLENAADIVSATLGEGNAGMVTINATELLEISSNERASIIGSDADRSNIRDVFQIGELSGNGGSITINTPVLRATGASQITVGNDGTGSAGDLKLNADLILLTNGAFISASTASGEGGNIAINRANLLLMDRGSHISATADGQGDGGNITIESAILLGLNNSDIIANAVEGNGGNVNITAQELLGLTFRDRLTPASDITASSEFGLDGTVEISTPDVDLSSQILGLPDTLIDVSQLVRSGCSLDEDQLVLAGRGGLPSSPMDLMDGDRPWFDLRNPFTQFHEDIAKPYPVERSVVFESPQEATGMAIAADGTVQLMAAASIPSAMMQSGCTVSSE